MFCIEKSNIDAIRSLILRNELSGELVEILPSVGGNINRLLIKKDELLHSILKVKKTKTDFEGTAIFNGAKLFPFPNRIDNGKYYFGENEYKLEINYTEENNACHGFIYNRDFYIVHQMAGDDFAEIQLAYKYNGEAEGYPFKFDILLTYRLQNIVGLTCITEVVNRDQKDLPLGDGWHPFIQINNCVDDLFLKFQSQCRLEVNQNLIPTGKTKGYNKFISGRKINDTKFDDCFVLTTNGSKHYTEIYSETKNLKIVLWQETGNKKYNYLQLYIPPQRDCIAVEPMTCAPNSFNNKKDLIILKSGEIFYAKFGIKIS